MISVHILTEDDLPCRGRRPAAVAAGAARVPCLLALLRRAALHPGGVRTAWAPPRGELSQGASVFAGGGTHSGWWPPLGSSGVTARRLPARLRDVLGPRPQVA